MAIARAAKKRQPLERKNIGPWILGIDEKSDPANVAENKCAAGQNCQLDEIPGDTIKRNGSFTLSTLPSGLAPRDTYRFVKSTGTEYALASDGTTLYQSQDGVAWTQLATGLNPTGFMAFETAEDKVWMSNGINNVMSWDGTTLVTYDREKTITQDNSSIDTTHVANTQLTEADNFWNGQKLVFTTGPNQGTVVTVTAYSQASHQITFTPALANGPGNTDRFKVGLIIPIGKTMRLWDSQLFIGCTTVNPSEERFNALVDPNTGVSITKDHPLAWPAARSVDVYSNDGDRIWGNSPILRDRFLIAKGNKIFRLERDSQTLYRPVLVTSSIGSRFQDTWCERDGFLLFVGGAKDGFPDIFKTDMVDVVPLDPLGGLEPTLRSLQQAATTQNFAGFFQKGDFDGGTKSTGIDTSNGDLRIAGYGDGQGVDFNAFFSNSNTAPDDVQGVLNLLGIPAWTSRYECSNLPTVDNPAWAIVSSDSNVSESISVGSLAISTITNSGPVGFGPPPGLYMRKQPGVLAASNHAYLYLKANGNKFHFGLWNGAKGAYVIVSGASATLTGSTSVSYAMGGGLHEYHLLLKTDGTVQLWIDGTMRLTVQAATTAYNKVQFGIGNSTNPGADMFNGAENSFYGTVISDNFYRVYFNSNLTNAVIPNNLPATGQIVLPFDFTRAPDALRNLFCKFLSNTFGGKCGTTSGSVTVQLDANVDMTRFSGGQIVDLLTISTRALITNGKSRTIQSVNVGAKTITIDAAGGNVTTDATTGVYIQAGGVTMESWTSSDSAFITGPDPVGFVAVAQGATPTSLVREFQRVRMTLTRADLGNSPEISALYNGMLWISPPIFIGQSITAWLSFLDFLNNGGAAPAGVFQGVKIRNATVLTTPTEAQWSAWQAITSGQNIGTILGDGAPPTSIWVQLKMEQGPGSSAGLVTLPIADSLQVQWLTGSASIFPFRAIVHKRRYMVVGALPGSTTNNIIIVNDRNGAWMKYFGLNFNSMEHFKGILLGFASDTAKIKQWDIQGRLDDDGAGIDAFIVTREEDLDAPHVRKDIRFTYLYIKGPVGYTITVSSKRNTDPGFAIHANITLDGNNDTKKVPFQAAFLARRLQRKYENAQAGHQMQISGETLFWHDRSAGT